MPRTPQPRPAPRAGELPDEFALRKLVAKARLQAARKAFKSAGLSVHAAADRGRRNRDWKANNGSADLAIIPDSLTLLGRSRQLARDSWVARSIVRAFARNVVGRGIEIVPHAKDPKGQPLTDLNLKARAEFDRWSRSKHCDVERRQTFSQKQRLAAKERETVGEHLWMWSYAPPLTADGRMDLGRPVGMRVQAFEPEQFDLRILSFEGREVRGGVEVDANGAPLAYHLYTRNPNDVLYRHAFFSERVDWRRMFHYFEGERVLQTRGVTPLTPVMQDMRDLDRFRGATLTRALMEACIGVIIKSQNLVTGANNISGMTLNDDPNDTEKTDSGMVESDFVPGMVANLLPDEDVVPFVPQSPGNQYDPFTQNTIRGIGAGVGISGGQVMRRSESNYSAARQDMLEDRKEWEQEQDLIIDDLIRPTYETWFRFAAMEGRFDDVAGFDMGEFLAEPHRFAAAQYIPPAQTWIDPEKEANAFVVMLKNRLITREEIVALRGGRYYETIAKLKAETVAANDLNLSLPENVEAAKGVMELVKAMLANRLGTIDNLTANALDIEQTLEQAGLPRRKGYTPPLLPIVSNPGSPVTGDPIENEEGEVIGGGVEDPMPLPAAPAPGAAPSPNGNGNGKMNGKSKPGGRMSQLDGREFATREDPPVAIPDNPVITPQGFGDRVPLPQPPPPNVPHYRACTESIVSCATCSFLTGEQCAKFGFVVRPDYVCDAWAAKTLTENIGVPNVAKTFPPGPQPGQLDLESRFAPEADPSAPKSGT